MPTKIEVISDLISLEYENESLSTIGFSDIFCQSSKKLKL
jgi:hypothetical protein